MDIKNYVIYFMGDEFEKISGSTASQIVKAWNDGAKFILINGNAYACHQILSIKRIKRSEEILLYERANLIETVDTDVILNSEFKGIPDSRLAKINELYDQNSISLSSKKLLT